MATPSPMAASGRCIAVVGMNAVGKSGFGKVLASRLKLKRIDTDSEFRKKHGPEQAFIDAHGWEAFRRAEEEIVLRSILPGHVVVLGGGAVESPAVRAALKEKAVVIWIQAGRKSIHRNLKEVKVTRPEFRTGPDPAKLKELIQARNPQYEDIADVVLYPHLRFSERVPQALELLRRFMAK